MNNYRIRLNADLELLRMGLTPSKVEALAHDDPCRLLTSPTNRALLKVALQNDGTVEEFLDKMARWRGALGTGKRCDYLGVMKER